ncbi:MULTISPECIES: NADPH-dependent FMN reductase [Myroides]|uniref:NADPH-dependent FMN reductase n=1 Tax=Myroides albus TaxID=2562892 RepID=A0A6I3LL45_9FLAO|nr:MULTISPECIES: NAD(P)H-dependent oxidoreductase [Myroides]MTG99073.1 NADPH-dependent FMN reductase [Myroides albus]MVX37062.1 NADPH-dependent FMN reductase [Myroides sp. LoEW2-1]UVD79045.1 NAD(P)H-dependent oxidoreductase [Myroides albus]
MKITAFAASNSSRSINLELVKNVASQFNKDQINLLDLNDFEMPIYSQDRNDKGIPEKATKFNEIMQQSDVIIISLAEHNGTFSTAFKNIFDWASRADMQVFKNKPMLLLSTSPGARAGMGVMQAAQSIFPYFGGNIKANFSLPSFHDNFKDGQIVNEQLKQQLESTLESFKQAL